MKRQTNSSTVNNKGKESGESNEKVIELKQVTLKSYIIATRPWSLTASLTSVLVGTALAFRETHAFDYQSFIIVVVGALSVQIFANLINSIYDYRFKVDKKETSDDRTMFDLGLTEKSVSRMIMFFFFVCIVCAVALCFKIGHLPVITEHLLPLVLIGALISIFYTAAPLSLKYIGLGDIAIISAFGPLLVQGAFVSQTNFSSPLAYYYSIPIALTIEAILHVNNTRDIKFDQINGGFTLASKLGETKSFYLYVALYSIAYSTIFFLSTQIDGMLVMNLPVIVAPMLSNLFNLFRSKQWPSLCEKTGQFSFLFGVLYSIGILLTTTE